MLLYGHVETEADLRGVVRLLVLLALLGTVACSHDVTVEGGGGGKKDQLLFPVSDGGGRADVRTTGEMRGGELTDATSGVEAAGETLAGDALAAGENLLTDGLETEVGPEQVLPDVTTVEVLPDVPCLYMPAVGDFQPVLECYWDDPDQYTKYDDVVMTPAVANLTDDNHDGVIDVNDTPDIAFITYRYEQDGCCKSPGVLRVVSGACKGGLTQMSDEKKRLHEHFHISTPKLDNSGGLALGDIDGDGWPDIVGMTNTTGTIAWTAPLYDEYPPVAVALDSAAWEVFGGAGSKTDAIDDDVPDPADIIVGGSGDSTITFEWEWPLSSAAIATVKVYVWAKSTGGVTQLAGALSQGGATALAEAQPVSEWDELHRLVFEFPRNPFLDDIQWTNEDLDGLAFGVHLPAPGGPEVQVAKIAVVVGHVEMKWQASEPKGANLVTAAQPAIADLEKDGAPEVVIGRVALDGSTGAVKWAGTKGVGINSFFGPISVSGDINLDGKLEVIAGNTAYDSAGNELWTYNFGNDGTGCKSGGLPCDGFNATGDFDEDDFGEVVIVREGVVYVVEHDGTLKARMYIPDDNCNWNEGGPPTVADFDNDGEPEIGVAGADFYAVFDLECCENLPGCTMPPPGADQCAGPGIRWQVPNDDCSSRVTGSSVFDFDGDGSAEVVYNDEEKFRIFSGVDGTILFEKPNASHTRLEYAVIADTDSDANAEIVIVENGAGNPDPVPLQLWGDSHDNWVPTRRIWNQHAYHITHVTEGGLTPPGGEEPNWVEYNNFRQNLPDYDPFLAPDLTVTLLAPDLSGCPETVVLAAQVCNIGQIWVPAGIHVSFFDAGIQANILCQSGGSTSQQLQPGECVKVSCPWDSAAGGTGTKQVLTCVDDYALSCEGPGFQNECNEDNNSNSAVVSLCE